METYEIVPRTERLESGTILQFGFVLTIKNQGEDSEYFKAHLFILGHRDPGKPRVINESPTVLKSSVRLLVDLIASHKFPL